MSIISQDVLKTIVDAQVLRMSQTPAQLGLEAAASTAVAGNFDDMTSTYIMKFTENIAKLKAEANGATVHAAAIKFYERRILVYSGETV